MILHGEEILEKPNKFMFSYIGQEISGMGCLKIF